MIDTPYPCTIVVDRYSGIYAGSGVAGSGWLAFNCGGSEVDQLGWCGSDKEAASFWIKVIQSVGRVKAVDTAFPADVFVGKGNTPDNAYRDLVRNWTLGRLQDNDPTLHLDQDDFEWLGLTKAELKATAKLALKSAK